VRSRSDPFRFAQPPFHPAGVFPQFRL
jgi:hypothetical protein